MLPHGVERDPDVLEVGAVVALQRDVRDGPRKDLVVALAPVLRRVEHRVVPPQPCNGHAMVMQRIQHGHSIIAGTDQHAYACMYAGTASAEPTACVRAVYRQEIREHRAEVKPKPRTPIVKETWKDEVVASMFVSSRTSSSTPTTFGNAR